MNARGLYLVLLLPLILCACGPRHGGKPPGLPTDDPETPGSLVTNPADPEALRDLGVIFSRRHQYPQPGLPQEGVDRQRA